MTISTTVVPSLFHLKVISVSVTYVCPRDKSEVSTNLSYQKLGLIKIEVRVVNMMLITSTLSYQPKAAIQLGFQQKSSLIMELEPIPFIGTKHSGGVPVVIADFFVVCNPDRSG